MKKTVTNLSHLAVIVALFFSTLTHAQSYKWVKGGGSTSSLSPEKEQVKYSCTDDNGNVYTLSLMGMTNILADTFYRATARNITTSVHNFLASYDCNGALRWAKMLEGYGGPAEAGGLVYYGGSIYLTGALYSDALHYKYFGLDTTVTTQNFSSFIARLDTGNNGDITWLRFVGSNVSGNSLLAKAGKPAVDGAGYIHNLTPIKGGCIVNGSLTTTQAGTYDLKYDASGNLVTASQIVALDSVWMVNDYAYNKVSGSWFAIIGPSDYWYSVIGPVFNSAVCAFRSNNTIVWKDTTGANGALSKLEYDGFDNLYLTGSGQTGSYNIGGLTVDHVTGGKHTSIIRVDTNDFGRWSYTISGTTAICGLADLTLLPDGKIAATGNLTSKVFHGTDTLISTPGEGQNAMFVITDTGGHTIKFDQLRGAGFYDVGLSITSDKIGNVYIGGQVESNIWGGSLSPYVSNGGNSDYFVMKYGYDCSCTAVPTASYTSTATSASTFAFTFTGSAGYDSVRWQFGDGGTATTASPTHTYAAPGTYTACVRVFTPCGSNTYCNNIVVPTVGVPQLAAGSVSVYPNPATDELIITGHEHNATYRLMSITGATLQQGSLPSHRASIHLANQTPGMYVLEVIQDNGERSIARIVKE
ncbi:MAG: T9SS type A sorting domain-containing protein [Taibaiella sp.]|nr:T9SS type A sorting domain-containing protein [Taibaiella sp.]